MIQKLKSPFLTSASISNSSIETNENYIWPIHFLLFFTYIIPPPIHDIVYFRKLSLSLQFIYFQFQDSKSTYIYCSQMYDLKRYCLDFDHYISHYSVLLLISTSSRLTRIFWGIISSTKHDGCNTQIIIPGTQHPSSDQYH